MELHFRGRTTLALGAATAALVIGGGAYAFAGQDSGTLSACVHRKGGGLYEAVRCGKHDRKLSWSEVGPQGITGPAGARGANGTNGINGTNGSNGTNGTNGIGATTSPVGLVAGDAEDLAPLDSSASVYGACNSSGGNVIFLLGMDTTNAWAVAGSYSTYQLQADGTAIVQNGAATQAIGTYAVALTGSTGRSVLYNLIPTSSPGLASGAIHVTLGSGSGASSYEVSFDVKTVPGAADLCQGEVTVYPTS